MISHHCREISHWLPLAQTKKKKGNKVTRRLKTDRPPYMIASFHGLETVLRKSLKQQSWKRNVPSDTSRIFTEGNWRHLFKSLADKMAQNNSELDRMSETQAAQSDASNTNVNGFRKMSLQMVKSGLMDVPLKQKCAQRKMKWKGHIFKKGKNLFLYIMHLNIYMWVLVKPNSGQIWVNYQWRPTSNWSHRQCWYQ